MGARIEINQVAAHLAKVQVADLLRVRVADDGTVVVLLENGQKFRYTPEQVRHAHEELTQAAAREREAAHSAPERPRGAECGSWPDESARPPRARRRK